MCIDKKESNKRIKVLALIWSMERGGAQQILINNLRYFKNDDTIDFKVIVFKKATNSKFDKAIRNEKLNVIYLNNPRSKLNIPIIRYPFNIFVAIRAWKKIFQKEKPDVVHVHISELLKYTLPAIIQCRIPVRFDTLHSNPYRYKNFNLHIIKKAFQKNNFIAICLNEEQVLQAKEHYGIKEYEIIHNGIPIKEIKSKIMDKDDAKDFLGIDKATDLYIGVGRLDPIKNYSFMINVYKELYNRNPNSKLIIIGDGPLYEELLNEIKGFEKNIVLQGEVDNVIPFYCAAKKLLITSYSESTSLALLEAQICGTKSVVSEGVPKESVITNNVQQLSLNESVEKWAEVIEGNSNKVKPYFNENDYDLYIQSEALKTVYQKYYFRNKREKIK